MNTEFYTFGEILWDCLPSGRHAGGAPFNVAGHIAQLGVSVSLLSSVGQDALGDEILGLAEQKGVNVEFVDRARIGLPTGTAIATVAMTRAGSSRCIIGATLADVSTNAAEIAVETVIGTRTLLPIHPKGQIYITAHVLRRKIGGALVFLAVAGLVTLKVFRSRK